MGLLLMPKVKLEVTVWSRYKKSRISVAKTPPKVYIYIYVSLYDLRKSEWI